MLFYIALYILVLALIVVSQYIKKRWGLRIPSRFLAIVSIIILCVVAAIRDTSIGTDTSFYPLLTFDAAKGSSLSDFMETPIIGHEYLYYWIVYVCSTVFNSFPLLLFITEFLCVAPVYYVLNKVSSKTNSSKPLIIGMAIYLVFSYNLSFNMMRQMVAMAFCLVAFYDYYYKKYARALIWVILGCLFQTYTLIMIPIIVLYQICKTIKKNNAFLLFKTTLFFTMIAASLLLLPIVNFVDSVFPDLIATSFMNDFADVKNFSFAELAFWTMISVVTIFCKKGTIKDKSLDRFFDIILIISPFTAVLNYYIHFSGRILLYLQYVLLFVIIPVAMARKIKNRSKYAVSYAILFGAYWFYFYALLNVNETMPYIMSGAL